MKNICHFTKPCKLYFTCLNSGPLYEVVYDITFQKILSKAYNWFQSCITCYHGNQNLNYFMKLLDKQGWLNDKAQNIRAGQKSIANNFFFVMQRCHLICTKSFFKTIAFNFTPVYLRRLTSWPTLHDGPLKGILP